MRELASEVNLDSGRPPELHCMKWVEERDFLPEFAGYAREARFTGLLERMSLTL